MKRTKDLLKIVAGSSIPVLIQGESGAGKEVAARFIHRNSRRFAGAFIALNCGAIPANLMESILEGAVKGAYTGATADQMGVVRAADQGTLFLDEIGELPLESQSKLLRILQEKAVLPVGGTHSLPVDFRLICATNRDLKADAVAGRFREDLFFRLNVFPIRIPPLRERDDFSEIADDLWAEIQRELRPDGTRASSADGTRASPADGTRAGSACQQLPPEELRLLRGENWPGNIRQLKNVLQRYALLQSHGIRLEEILAEEFSTATLHEAAHLRRRTHAPSVDTIRETLLKYSNNKTHAANALGISRGSLCYQIRKADLEERLAG